VALLLRRQPKLLPRPRLSSRPATRLVGVGLFGSALHLDPHKSGGSTAESRPRKQLWLPPPQQSHSGSYIGRSWRLTTRWSFQPLTEPKELIEHYADSQQHQQRHDDGGRHSFIIPSPHRHRFTASDAGYKLTHAGLWRTRVAFCALPRRWPRQPER